MRIAAAAVALVVVVVAAAAAAAADTGACRSVEGPSAVAVVVAFVAAFVAEAYRAAAAPSVFARKGFAWRFAGSSDCSAAACLLAAGNSATVAGQALVGVH